jgi:hypothetical protein
MPAAATRRSAPSFVVRRSARPGKKWTAQGTTRSGRRVTVQFGARGYQDYTQHGDAQRRARYLTRHRARESWGAAGIGTAGFWSRWLLWNRPTVRASAADISRRFGVRVSVAAA